MRNSLSDFIRQHRAEIDQQVRAQSPETVLTDDTERHLWILKDENYQWARRNGYDDGTAAGLKVFGLFIVAIGFFALIGWTVFNWVSEARTNGTSRTWLAVTVMLGGVGYIADREIKKINHRLDEISDRLRDIELDRPVDKEP